MTRFIIGTPCDAIANATVDMAAQAALAHIHFRSPGVPRKLFKEDG